MSDASQSAAPEAVELDFNRAAALRVSAIPPEDEIRWVQCGRRETASIPLDGLSSLRGTATTPPARGAAWPAALDRSTWRMVLPHDGERLRWEAGDGRWVSLAEGYSASAGVFLVTDSRGRCESAEIGDDALALARAWRT